MQEDIRVGTAAFIEKEKAHDLLEATQQQGKMVVCTGKKEFQHAYRPLRWLLSIIMGLNYLNAEEIRAQDGGGLRRGDEKEVEPLISEPGSMAAIRRNAVTMGAGGKERIYYYGYGYHCCYTSA